MRKFLRTDLAGRGGYANDELLLTISTIST
jgi:hypothetical protein